MRTTIVVLVSLWFGHAVPFVASFSPMKKIVSHHSYFLASPRTNVVLQAQSGEEQQEDESWSTLWNGDEWELINDFDLFLNQCTIQSLLFLIVSLKDRHTAIWLEDFTQPVIRRRTKHKADDYVLSNMAEALNDAMHETRTERQIHLLTYHGLGAINTTKFPTWDSYFEQLLEEQAVTYIIESSRPHVPSYELDINPASLCSRLISVREQLAREFATDLDLIVEMSADVIPRYFEKIKQQQEPNTESNNKNGLGKYGVDFMLEMNVDYDYKPSPLRKGNVDLLLLLTTQESIHRILNDSYNNNNNNGGDETSKRSAQFLQNFYAQRVGSHFTGSNYYGRAEDFLEELLQTPPTSGAQLQDDDEASSGLPVVDPVAIVKQVLNEREKVAEEWLDAALDIPNMHSKIKRKQLDILMGRTTTMNAESTGSFE